MLHCHHWQYDNVIFKTMEMNVNVEYSRTQVTFSFSAVSCELMGIKYVNNKTSGCVLHTRLVKCHGCLVILCMLCKAEEWSLESWGTVSPFPENPFFIKSTFLHLPKSFHLILHCPFYKRERFWFRLHIWLNTMPISQSEGETKRARELFCIDF